MLKVIKPSTIYECLLGFCFNIFCAATNFGCIDSFLLPNSRNEEMMGDGFLMLLLPVCFNSKRLLSIRTAGQRSSEQAFFSWCYSRCFFEVRRIVACRKLNKP